MSLKLALGILIFALAGSSAFADDRTDACSKVDADDARLRCYDAVFRPVPSAAVAPPSAPVDSKWNVTTETSAIDDSQNVFMVVEGTNGILDRLGNPTKMELWIACREKKTSLWVRFGGQFMSDIEGNGDVTYRLDKKKAVQKSLTVSSNNEALGLWNGGSSIPFIKGLFGANEMFLQGMPFNESAVNDVFPVAGIEAAIAPLRKSCAW